MSTTRPWKIGRVRIKLAALLNEKIPTARFEPHNLNSQIPFYATPQQDCCSWYADGKDSETGLGVHVSSYSTMSKCVRYGIDVSREDRFNFEVDASEQGL